VAKPADYGTHEDQRDIYTLDQGDPLFKPRNFETAPPRTKPSLGRPPAPPSHEPVIETHSSPDLPTSFYEANGASYLKARRLAEIKFNTIKLIIAFSIVSIGLVALDAFLYPEIWWSYWPIAFTAFILAFPAAKCFLFGGQDVRSVIESRLHKMALREVERYDSDL